MKPPRVFLLAIFFIAVVSITTLDITTAEEEVRETIKVEIAIYPPAKQIPIIIDNSIYIVPTLDKLVVLLDKNVEHTISIAEPTIYIGQGVRLVFDRWSTGEQSPTLRINGNRSVALVAIYNKQYYVEVVSQYGNVGGAGWYNEGDRVNLSVEEVIYLDNNTRVVFDKWSYGVLPWSTNNYFYVFEPVTVTASWKTQYRVEVSTEPLETNVVGSGWYYRDSIVSVRAQKTVDIREGVQYRFENWTVEVGELVLDDYSKPEIKFVIRSPVKLTAHYAPYYLVEVKTPFGNISGNGYYREGDTALIAVQSPYVASPNIRYVFSSWKGDVRSRSNVLSIVVEEPLVIEATWKKQYFVRVDSKVPAVKGDGWYDEGSTAILEASRKVEDRFGIAYVFKGWQGDIDDLFTRVEVKVDSPKQVTALWSKSYSGLYIRFIVLIVVVIGLYIF